MPYDTTNLDEAAYLALQGFPFTITRTAHVAAIFSFTVGEAFEEIRGRFWKGEVTVQLHLWLATRTGLKHSAAGQRSTVKKIASPSLVPAQPEVSMEMWRGFPYWYWEGDSVKCNKFSDRPLHTDRFHEKNAYRSREDAFSRRNVLATEDLYRAPPVAPQVS